MNERNMVDGVPPPQYTGAQAKIKRAEMMAARSGRIGLRGEGLVDRMRAGAAADRARTHSQPDRTTDRGEEADMSDLTLAVKNLATAQGAHLVGVASVDRFEGAPRGHHPTDLLPSARSVVVIAHRFFQSVLDCNRFGLESELIPRDELWHVQETIFMHLYHTANMRLQMIASQLAAYLEDRGHASLPLPAGGFRVGAERYAFFSHRHAAVLAGLGEFGLNNLLLTPQYGPRQRLNSIITTAELAPDALCDGPICLGQEACGLCLQADACFGEIHELQMAGRTMQLARFTGGCLSPNRCRRLNPEGDLPHSRYCWGVCPVGSI
jgi:epoxyqueuosine reductase QueG